MSPSDVKHFLLIYDTPSERLEVIEFGTDEQRALQAYEDAEERHRNDDDHEVVLLGSDSLETLRKTHSSYFELNGQHVNEVVRRELADLGIR